MESQADYISGSWSDACPCPVPCPCWRTLHSSSQECVNLQVFHVESGRVGKRNLAGAVFILVNLPLSQHSAPRASRLIIDSSLDNDTALAIQNMLGRFFSSAQVLRKPISFESTNSGQHALITDLIEYQVDFSSRIPISTDVADYLYPWLSDPQQGKTTKVVYNAQPSAVVKYSGTNSILARFFMVSPTQN